jgi:hypothetical protein
VEHSLARDRYHHRWERDTEPTLEIASGDEVVDGGMWNVGFTLPPEHSVLRLTGMGR